MSKDNLRIIATSDSNQSEQKHKTNPRDIATAHFERLWLQNPNQFIPASTAKGSERIRRTWTLLSEFITPPNLHIVDLGCGDGTLSRQLHNAGAIIVSLDIASNALKYLKEHGGENIDTRQGYVPKTTLEDNHYDVVICTDLIGYLPPEEYRLFFSELARLVTPQGYVLCSTDIDIHSDNALQRFADLAVTEFDIKKWSLSYHALYIILLDFFKAPSRFYQASKDKNYRQKALNKRFSIGKWWFKINTTSITAPLWKGISYVTNPLAKAISTNTTLLLLLEKISRGLWGERAISHAIFIGKRRPLAVPIPDEWHPKERPQKRQIWE